MKNFKRKRENSIEKVTPKIFKSCICLTLIILMGVGQSFAQILISNNEVVRALRFEADLTGSEVNGETPTGKLVTLTYPLEERPESIEYGVIENLFLPKDITSIDYLLNGKQRNTFTTSANSPIPGWNFFDSKVNPVQVGDVAEVKNGEETIVSGTYRRLIYDFVPYDTALSTDFVVPTIEVEADFVFGGVSAQYYPEENRLALIVVGVVPEPCTNVTLNAGAEGTLGGQVAQIPILVSGPNNNLCLAGGEDEESEGFFNITLTDEQEESLESNLLYISIATESYPDGILRGQLINPSTEGDFEGDGRSDLAVWRPNEAKWIVQSSSDNSVTTTEFGNYNDWLVTDDYDGDKKSDLAAWQIQGGIWKIKSSSDGTTEEVQWGRAGDIPMSVNIDGDSKTDLAVFRPSNGNWYIRRRGDIIKPFADTPANRDIIFKWGVAGDKPLVADFDGDGFDDFAIFRPSNGTWYIYNLQNQNYEIIKWGLNEDIPVAADYDGDGKADVAVYRPSDGIWYIYGSAQKNYIFYDFGLEDDIPTVSDFDRDGVADIAVYRPSNGVWYRLNSSDNSFTSRQFGIPFVDIPVLARF